ncbi:GNAT family N-acetyltransferase [Kribbella turkmenica]|uniref:GNAT family N-acetyltransferase n=1 Tax=Kribbella turkmenica TaxID=2530375 RepID=A0A4R4XER9_9ACTN|nr:GNAT family N-acetyltransferase [Kribbella turkmenica]TDD29195.1 GNAT family N-acetyltransferase [Kribbella turkmenica]
MRRPERLRLRPLTNADEYQALSAHEELAQEVFEFLIGWDGQPWALFLTQVDGWRTGTDLPDGWVPATFLVAEAAGELVGRISIRHQLNELLLREGGHIGYGVISKFRGRGFATEMLRQSLDITRSLGIDRLLLVCDEANTASATVIENCGGKLESVATGGPHAGSKRRYWIELP